jgi:hypothetical protein
MILQRRRHATGATEEAMPSGDALMGKPPAGTRRMECGQ